MVAEKGTIRGTHRPRRVNPYPDVRFPTHEPLSRRSSCPDVRFPTRKPLFRRLFSGRVNPSPYVRFPYARNFETVSICDRSSYWSFNAFSQHMKSFNMRFRFVKHSDVPWRVRTSTLLGAWGVRYALMVQMSSRDSH